MFDLGVVNLKGVHKAKKVQEGDATMYHKGLQPGPIIKTQSFYTRLCK